MTIAAIEPVGVAASTKTTAADAAIMGKDDFLNLLVAQLQHQDPLSPLDSTDFTAQLAQFTSLEQLNNINAGLERLQKDQASLKNAQAIDLIGKTVEAPGSGLVLNQGGAEPLGFDLEQDVEYLAVNIYGPAGNFIRTIESGPLSAGRHSVNWDGRDQQGTPMPDGQYSFEILATDRSGEAAKAVPFVGFRVTGVNFDGPTPTVLGGGYGIPLDQVREVTAD